MRPERVRVSIPGNRIVCANVFGGKSHGMFRKLKEANEAEELEFEERVVPPSYSGASPLLLNVHTVEASE